jgi:hypothetical protein
VNALPPTADLGGRDPSTHVAEIGQAVHIGLMDLQQRIGELQRSVDTLGAEGRWMAVGPAPRQPFAPMPPVPPPMPLAPAEWEQAFEPPFTPTPPPSWAAPPPAPPVPAPRQQAPQPPPGVTLLDVGPFADLIELRHFEEELAAVSGVHDVRVRRFGHGRARIEVGATPHELMAAIGSTHAPAEISERAGGEIVVELPAAGEGEGADGEPEEAAEAG